ncbi:CocE/NonD family hydrolase [Paenarthrobacter sp. NPDC089989]|uniref:CocE/NonD family hydrolase n=1 Tax=unclassified Paenarthrobacter TaxID=2634190 RepID=UPI003807F853
MTTATGVGLLDVTADDGVRLTADHYRTSLERPARGLVLIRTPYGRHHYAAQAGPWLGSGYEVIVQDVRGRYGSGGQWDPYASEGPDGAATVRRLAECGVLTGPLILAGASYDAHCAVECARSLNANPSGPATAPPVAVVAMVPALGLHETAYGPDGSPRLEDRIGWWHQHGFGAESRPPLTEAELRRRHRLSAQRGMDWVRRDLVTDTQYGTGSAAKWQRLWDAQPLDLWSRYGTLSAPLLVISGERDFFTAEALDLAEAWGRQRQSTRVEVLWGPWGHGLAGDLDAGTRHALKQQGGLLDRIDEFLVGAQKPTEDPVAHRTSAQPPTRTVWRWRQESNGSAWTWEPTTLSHLRPHGEA